MIPNWIKNKLAQAARRAQHWLDKHPQKAPAPIPAPAPVQQSGTVPSDGYYRVLHDFEDPEYNFTPRSISKGLEVGLPETVKTLVDTFAELDKAWQEFWFAQIVRSAAGTIDTDALKHKWAQFTRTGVCFTDFHGSDTCADFINGTNQDKAGIGIEALVTGGNVILQDGESIQRGGNTYIPYVFLDTRNAPPLVDDVNIQKTPWLIHTATTETPFHLPGTNLWRCNNFPQLGGLPVPYPVIYKSRGAAPKNYIRLSRLTPLRVGDPWPTPFVPEQ